MNFQLQLGLEAQPSGVFPEFLVKSAREFRFSLDRTAALTKVKRRMPGPFRTALAPLTAVLVLAVGACSSASSASKPTAPVTRSRTAATQQTGGGALVPGVVLAPSLAARSQVPVNGQVMLGIDVLAAENFARVAGKRVALLTHPAGVNRLGVPTVDVLRRAPNIKLVALFGPEHGIYGDAAAGENVSDTVDRRTGLPAYSLHGKHRKPTKEQLKGVQVMVIDLQDIGVRSYTYNVTMRNAIEACFENNVEVVVLDRPNPLGGLKVDGPILDPEWMKENGVGAFPVPYVHGLTIGELARMAVSVPGILEIPDSVRQRGRLSVVPMRGWRRNMRWPETGLNFTATSPKIQDFASCVGYAMTGLGCQLGDFKHGIGTQYPFRGIYYNGRNADLLQRELESLRLPGVAFRKIAAVKRDGKPTTGVYVEVTDWDDWRPTELSFHLMRLACRLSGRNPFASASQSEAVLFNKHTGSTEWWNALRRQGANIDVEAFRRLWDQRNLAYQQQSRRFWLYN